MIRALLLVFSFSFSLSVFAAIPESLDPNQWNNLLTQIQTTGVPSSYPQAEYLTLSRIVPDNPDQPRIANYISTVGYYQIDGSYIPLRIESSSEVWKITAEGHWDIDQWLFVASLNGDLRQSMHRHIIKTQDSIVLKLETLPQSEDEKLQAWDLRVQEWFKFTPQ